MAKSLPQSYYVIHQDYGDNGYEAIVTKQSVDRDEVICDLADGQYETPERIDFVDFNTGTVCDVSQELHDAARNIVIDEGRTEDDGSCAYLDHLDLAIFMRKRAAREAARKEAA